MVETAALPSVELLEEQAHWLASARARLLRGVAIAHCRRVLDLGAGCGVVTPELVRRARGPVVALDREIAALQDHAIAFAGALCVGGNALHLPFADGGFDLVFCQLTLLWISPLVQAIEEIWRVLAPGGALVALEPDYGGMMEHPQEIATRELWLNGLTRAGADPCVGRKLPTLLSQQGFTCRVALFDTLEPPHPSRFELLRGLPLEPEEQRTLQEGIRQSGCLSGNWTQVAHLPFFLVTALKPRPFL